MIIFHLITGEKLPCHNYEANLGNDGTIDSFFLHDGSGDGLFSVPRERVSYIKCTREPYGDR